MQANIKRCQPKILLSVFKKAAEKLMDKSYRGIWGFTGDNLENAEVFILPFPYRKKELVDNHMKELIKKI